MARVKDSVKQRVVELAERGDATSQILTEIIGAIDSIETPASEEEDTATADGTVEAIETIRDQVNKMGDEIRANQEEIKILSDRIAELVKAESIVNSRVEVLEKKDTTKKGSKK